MTEFCSTRRLSQASWERTSRHSLMRVEQAIHSHSQVRKQEEFNIVHQKQYVAVVA